ncbi:MAG: hypothetical protein ACRCU5_05200, partial [Rhizobiaceae bacterium]
MADFVAILNKTIDGLGERNTPEMRQRVYDRAKKAVSDKLAAVTPPPSAAQSARQFKLLDDAIATIEANYAPPPVVEAAAPKIKPASSDPLADFLASVEANDGSPARVTPVIKPISEAPRANAPAFPQAANVSVRPVESLDPVLGLDGQEQLSLPGSIDVRKPAKKKSGFAGVFSTLLGLLLIGGAGYAGYIYKDEIQTYVSSIPLKLPNSEAPAAKVEPEKAAEPTPVATAEPMATEPTTPAAA